MTEHTSGPWKIKGNSLLILADACDITLAHIFLPLRGRAHYRSVPERNANASLIKASPELLAELVKAREIVVKWCSYQGTHQDLHDTYVKPIDDIIAKARGEND